MIIVPSETMDILKIHPEILQKTASIGISITVSMAPNAIGKAYQDAQNTK